MHEVLELCIELDTLAGEIYEHLAGACPDEDLRSTFGALAAEEASHVEWWRELLDVWERGLLPDLVCDCQAVASHLREVRDELQRMAERSFDGLTVDEMLAITARMEFFMIDPVFGELIDLTEPGSASRRHEEYARHLKRLVAAIRAHYDPGSLAGFLSGILDRVWRDNLTLATYATRDPLTGLYNRRALDSYLPQWTAWAARYGRPLAVILADIDLFKGVNDDHGHLFGDRALRAVADALRAATRASDLVIRYGGDEFAVIAPETGHDDYDRLVQRIVTTVRSLDLIDDAGAHVPLSVSVGGAIAHDPAGSHPRRPDHLLASADQSLYVAKRSGRNRAAEPVLLGVG